MDITTWLPPRNYIVECIKRALDEDIGAGDITTDVLIDRDSCTNACIISREPLVLSGIPLILMIIQRFDGDAVVTSYKYDGQLVPEAQVIAEIHAKTHAILSTERTILNFLQRLSGIATITHRFVEAVSDTGVILVDTRKTTPGMRLLEKYAVRCGRGKNHRMCLSDGILVKDNHLRCFNSIKECVNVMKSKIGVFSKVEVEVESIEQLEDAIDAGVDIVMLDNMNIDEIKRAVEISQGRVLLEVSGNVNLDNIQAIANTGVDIISTGYITHSAPWVDISLEIK